MNYYIPKYFKIWELLPRRLYRQLQAIGWPDDKMWRFFDPRTLYVGDQIRKRYGKMIANTWYWGGNHDYRGFRPPDCGVGAPYSQHRFGRAQDLVPIEVTVEEIWAEIEAGDNFEYITCIEKTSIQKRVTWLHHDERNYEGLLIVYPRK